MNRVSEQTKKITEQVLIRLARRFEAKARRCNLASSGVLGVLETRENRILVGIYNGIATELRRETRNEDI